MTIQEVITKAIEGGWNPKEEPCSHKLMHDESGCPCVRHYPSQEKILLDPLFWQCLGKALGWGDESECPLACCGGICPINIPMWQSQWHRFISHLSGGGTIGSFFENIEE